MIHNNSERPGLVDRLVAHGEQQKAVPAQRTRRIDLDQIRSRLATADPGQVDHMVEEVEELRFGHEAFNLAQEYLAAGKLDRARYWLAVAARHDIEEAEPLLADVDVILEALEPSRAADVDDWAALEQINAADEGKRRTVSVDDFHDAAEALRQAHFQAESIVRAAQKSADEILVEARRETNSRDDAVPVLWNLANLLDRVGQAPETGLAVKWLADARNCGADARRLAELLDRVGQLPETGLAVKCLADTGNPGATREHVRWLLRAAETADPCDHTRIWHPQVAALTPSRYLAGSRTYALRLALTTAAAVEGLSNDPVARAWIAAARQPEIADEIAMVYPDPLSSCVDRWHTRAINCSILLDHECRLWTPSDRTGVSDASSEQRPGRERIVAGPKFRQAIDDLKEQMTTAERGLVPMASGQSA